jgi:hypothetical protein
MYKEFHELDEAEGVEHHEPPVLEIDK